MRFGTEPTISTIMGLVANITGGLTGLAFVATLRSQNFRVDPSPEMKREGIYECTPTQVKSNPTYRFVPVDYRTICFGGKNPGVEFHDMLSHKTITLHTNDPYSCRPIRPRQ